MQPHDEIEETDNGIVILGISAKILSKWLMRSSFEFFCSSMIVKLFLQTLVQKRAKVLLRDLCFLIH